MSQVKAGIGFAEPSSTDGNNKMVIVMSGGLQRRDLDDKPTFKAPNQPKRSLLGLDKLAKEKEAEKKRQKIEQELSAKTPVRESQHHSQHHSRDNNRRDSESRHRSSSSSDTSSRRPSHYDSHKSSSSSSSSAWNMPSSQRSAQSGGATPQRRDPGSVRKGTSGGIPLPMPGATPRYVHCVAFKYLSGSNRV